MGKGQVCEQHVLQIRRCIFGEHCKLYATFVL
jgi:hypothetical protein